MLPHSGLFPYIHRATLLSRQGKLLLESSLVDLLRRTHPLPKRCASALSLTGTSNLLQYPLFHSKRSSSVLYCFSRMEFSVIIPISQIGRLRHGAEVTSLKPQDNFVAQTLGLSAPISPTSPPDTGFRAGVPQDTDTAQTRKGHLNQRHAGWTV